MATVTILQYDTFTHAPSGVRFERTRVQAGTGVVYLGVAEVDDATARRHFVGHDGFRVEGLAPEADPDALPDDFPGREHLAAAGLATRAAVAAQSDEALVALPGIGKAAVGKIRAALAA